MTIAAIPNTLSWLQENPSFDALCARFPEAWRVVEAGVDDLIARGDMAEIAAVAARSAKAPSGLGVSGARGSRQHDAVLAEVERRMTVEAVRRACNGLATGVDGTVRFNLLNGWLLQRLLFRQGLERKAVPILRFKFVWRLAWQRRHLMTLVQPKGIYCFYSRELIGALASIIGDQTTLEIAAGDGTLSRLLSDAGVPVTATDDHSWGQSISYPDFVERQDAKVALRRRQPKVVVCCWPPVGNKFERDVFDTRSVDTYIVVTTRHEHAAGNWETYRRQNNFDFAEVVELSRLVLPPELDPIVLVFRRRSLQLP